MKQIDPNEARRADTRKLSPQPNDPRIHFAVLAIEATARKMGITPAQMQARLQKQGLVKHYLMKYYNTLHTQSLAWVAEDTTEVLHNWEAEAQAAAQARAAETSAADNEKGGPA